MRIAVLSFGSLVNQIQSDNYNHSLEVKKPEGGSAAEGLRIREGSPFALAGELKLPVRLGRLSQVDSDKRRVTNILHPKASNELVFYADSKFSNLNEAIKNLREREGIPSSSYHNIGYVNLDSGTSRSKMDVVANRVKQWAEQKGYDAVIWTDLSSNVEFAEKSTGREILPFLNNDPVLLKNTKQYIESLPTPLNALQKHILALADQAAAARSSGPNQVQAGVVDPLNAYKASLTADFAVRDQEKQTNTPKSEWFSNSGNGWDWGPFARKYSAVNAPAGVDPIEWKRDRVVEVAKRYAAPNSIPAGQNIPPRAPELQGTDPNKGLPYAGPRMEIDGRMVSPKRGHFPARGWGLDCSNFASWVYNYGLGIQFNSHIDQLWSSASSPVSGRKLNADEPLKKGDLLFYKGNVKHVIMYIDPEHYIDSTSAHKEGVAVRKFNDPSNRWLRPGSASYLGARRIIE